MLERVEEQDENRANGRVAGRSGLVDAPTPSDCASPDIRLSKPRRVTLHPPWVALAHGRSRCCFE